MSYCMMFDSSLVSVRDSAGRTASFGRTIVTFLPEAAESNIICALLYCSCCRHPTIAMATKKSSVGSRVFISVVIQNCRVESLMVPAREHVVRATGISEVCIHPQEQVTWMKAGRFDVHIPLGKAMIVVAIDPLRRTHPMIVAVHRS